MIALGIDPGLTGAICGINSVTRAVVIVDMPTREVIGGGMVKSRIDGRELANAMRALAPADLGPPVVTCELVHAIAGKREGQGGMQQMASLMRSFGAIEAILDAMRYPCSFVRPQEWKKFYDLGATAAEKELPQSQRSTAMKRRALEMAHSLYPQTQATSLRLAKHHNRAEALLLAHFGLSRHA